MAAIMGRFARVVYPERRGTRRAISNDGYITILIERYFKLPCVSSACQILPARLHSVELAILRRATSYALRILAGRPLAHLI
jgi:hypothetical protein